MRRGAWWARDANGNVNRQRFDEAGHLIASYAADYDASKVK